MPGALRRSARAPKANKKYSIDPFEAHQDILMDDANDTKPPSEAESSDDDFDANKVADDDELVAAQEAEDSEDVPEVDILPKDSDENQPSATRFSLSDEESLIEVSPNKASQPSKRQRAKLRVPSHADRGTFVNQPIFEPLGGNAAKGRNIQHTRGIDDGPYHSGRGERTIYIMGAGEDDQVAHVRTRDRWGHDSTLPFRRWHDDGIGGGLAFSSFYPDGKRKREAQEEMEWYWKDGGQKLFLQASKDLQYLEDDSSYIDEVETSDDIVAGSVTSLQHFDGIKPFQSWNFAEAFASDTKSAKHDAWTINVGGRIQALEWAPNLRSGLQVLVVATVHRKDADGEDTLGDAAIAEEGKKDEDAVDEIMTAPSYTPRPSKQWCLQFWEINAQGKDGDTGSKIDFSRKPVLRCSIFTTWGYVKKLKWCPTQDLEAAEGERLGLLGAIFSDGKLRVYDMFLPPPKQDGKPRRIHIGQVAFEVKPPDCLCTDLTWLSSRNIAVSTTDGSVAIWNLPDTLRATAEGQTSPRPWFYQHLHQAYIVSISSGYPSRPHTLFTHSMDGYLMMLDLRAPHQDNATAQRARVAHGPIVWQDSTQSLLNVDDNYFLKAYAHRMFYKATSVARLTALGQDVAVSLLHPSVLVACADGTVWATNPIRRLRDHKTKPLSQCVLKHEWRRPVHSQPAGEDVVMLDVDARDSVAEMLLCKPLIRMVTGFKIVESDMGQEGRTNKTSESVIFATIYEEETSATRVAWNPNLRAGTWAAMSFATGLVMVRDLAAD